MNVCCQHGILLYQRNQPLVAVNMVPSSRTRSLAPTSTTPTPLFLSSSSLEDTDPAQYPSLGLTGNIISATICGSYKVSYIPGEDWQLNSRRGTSALFDPFAFLSSEHSKWNHRPAGWPGEFGTAATSNSEGTSMSAVPLSGASAPVSISTNHEAGAYGTETDPYGATLALELADTPRSLRKSPFSWPSRRKTVAAIGSMSRSRWCPLRLWALKLVSDLSADGLSGIV